MRLPSSSLPAKSNTGLQQTLLKYCLLRGAYSHLVRVPLPPPFSYKWFFFLVDTTRPYSNLIMSAKSTVGFIGLGAMGFGMATNLVARGHQVKGYDVFPASVERFEKAGGIGAKSLLDVVEDVKDCVCMVATAAQAQDVLINKGVVKGARMLE